MDENINQAMAFGIPADEVDLIGHYQTLASASVIEKNDDNTVVVWVDDDDALSVWNIMTRSLMEYIPAGGQAPDGSLLEQPCLVLVPWPWDFIEMSRNNPAGHVLPSKVFYGNADEQALRASLEKELDVNPRYDTLNAAAKTELADRFLNGETKLLVNSETAVGRGLTETVGANIGRKRLDLVFYSADNDKLAPEDVLEIIGLVGGSKMTGHPLLEGFARPVFPAVAPLEGGIRIRIRGSVFDSSTVVQAGGVDAAELRISSEGDTLFATLPPRDNAGYADVAVITDGHAPSNFEDAVFYSNTIADTVKSVVTSYLTYLHELKDVVDHHQAQGTLTGEIAEEIDLEWGVVRANFSDLINHRSANGGGSIASPEVRQALEQPESILRTLNQEIYAAIKP